MAAMEAEDYMKAAEIFGQVAQSGKGALAATAAMNQADMLLRAGKAVEAVGVLEPLEKNVSDTVRPLVLESLAAAAEAAGDTQRATQAYQTLISTAAGQDTSYYKARLDALTPAQPGK